MIPGCRYSRPRDFGMIPGTPLEQQVRKGARWGVELAMSQPLTTAAKTSRSERRMRAVERNTGSDRAGMGRQNLVCSWCVGPERISV
eukprot:10891922-Karenia_brevis.AAC.1